MRAYRFASALAVATFVLLVIGGLVHPTGSSLACPDWPLCNGMVFPPMRGGILYEHGHRLAALTVALLTVGLAVLLFRDGHPHALRRMGLAAVVLVGVQAALGALTVVYRLPLVVSASHLATSMAFFALVLTLAWRLRPPGPAAAAGARTLVGLSALAVYLQIVLGALVRHTGSALACGTDLVLCEGAAWPRWGPAQVHFTHRLFGYAVAVLVLAASARLLSAPAEGPPLRRALAWAGPVLVLAQLALGLWTVASYVALPVVALHLAAGAALLACQLTLFLALDASPLETPA